MITISGKYYISNITGEIHNANDADYYILEHEPESIFTDEIEILDEDGMTIDRCTLYHYMSDLIKAISK